MLGAKASIIADVGLVLWLTSPGARTADRASRQSKQQPQRRFVVDALIGFAPSRYCSICRFLFVDRNPIRRRVFVRLAKPGLLPSYL